MIKELSCVIGLSDADMVYVEIISVLANHLGRFNGRT